MHSARLSFVMDALTLQTPIVESINAPDEPSARVHGKRIDV
jgi:hypothetical protein